MRKRYRVLILAILVVALAVPVGFALSLEAPSTQARASSNTLLPATLPQLPDAAKLLLVGTTLFGLAAFVRKSA